MPAPARQGADAQAGQCIGPDHDPDTFRLLEYVGRGGEGELWLADDARSDGRTRRQWALKIMHARNLTHRDDVSPLAELDERFDRYVRSKRETDQLAMAVPGVVGASDIFKGGEPHAVGDVPRNRSLYVVSPWVEGCDLATWRLRTRPSFDRLCDVVERLATIVDGMASHVLNVVHRDISPGNVLVRDGDAVALIDFTFVRPPNTSAGTVAVHNGGYTAPEVYRRDGVGVAADRYSVGAVTHFLLTGHQPPEENTAVGARAELRRRGFSTDLAEHVASMLAADPERRPTDLRAWAKALRRFGQRRAAGNDRVTVELVVDGTGSPVVLTAGESGTATARLAPGLPRRLDRDRASPPGLCAATAATDGSGTPVVIAVDDAGGLWVGRSQTWVEADPVRPDTGVAAVRLPTGATAAFAVEPSEQRLACLTVELDGTWRRSRRSEYVGHVLAAAAGPDGSPVVAALAPGGGLVCIEAAATATVCDTEVTAADVCLNQWGELLCAYVIGSGSATGTVAYAEQFSGSWGSGTPLPVPGTAVDVACVGTRDGVAIAVGGTAGLHLATLTSAGVSPWHSLTDRPCRQVALAIGAAWRLQLAAVVDEQVKVAAEGFGHWEPLRPL